MSGLVGETIPANTRHAVSVSLPTWRSNVAYEEGEDWVLSQMATGYPRFFINKLIVSFAENIVRDHGTPAHTAMLFPTPKVAQRCTAFLQKQDPSIKPDQIQIINFVLDPSKKLSETLKKLSPTISAVIYATDKFHVAKQFWQHTGEGVSSRRAESCHRLYQDGLLIVQGAVLQNIDQNAESLRRGPRRYQRGGGSIGKMPNNPTNGANGNADLPLAFDDAETGESQFVEERFGRNLDISYALEAKKAIRRRIAGSLVDDVELNEAHNSVSDTEKIRGVANLSPEDVYLYPCGMNSIFHTHRMLMKARGHLKSISFGFPYVDTLKILQKFGPGCLFYGNGSGEDLDDLERRLEAGEGFLALFCEFPGNPLLTSPNLARMRKLADTYDFALVIDETIGNFINIHVLPYADVVVSSLTKIFTGEANVMGGSLILNPTRKYYKVLKNVLDVEYEDNYWDEDAIFMERNSRDFVSRIERIKKHAEIICATLVSHATVKQVYYPKLSPTKANYDMVKTPDGGYGGLLSVTFHDKKQAVAFYDEIDTAKGPSLGTNFTLTSPYVLLAHYGELEWAAGFGAEVDLIRISVGLEVTTALKATFAKALEAASLAL